MKSSKKKILFWLILTICIFMAGIIGIVITSEYKLSQLVPGGLGERFPTKVYSSPFLIQNGMTISSDEMLNRLQRLNYSSSRANPLPRGSYRWEPPHLSIALRGFDSPIVSQDISVFNLNQSPEGWIIRNATETTRDRFYLEPELIAELSGPQKVRRDPSNWDELPPLLVDAVIAVEDRRFYVHHGVDLRAILRAAWFNIRHHKNLQGGSTITQQLAKNFFLSQERTLRRKFLEVGFAVYLDLRYPKERIMTLYLNHIYMGQDGVVSVAGMKAAAQFYFEKTLKELNHSEVALLAGIIRSPYRYNPFQNPALAKKRRDTVLKLMMNQGVITELEFERALATPIKVKKRTNASVGKAKGNDYFVAEVLRQLVPRFSEDIIFRYGLKIFTTVDPVWQQVAQSNVKNLKSQVAMVVMDPNSGRVLALVGGKDFQESQFNRATQALRQPGSAFKPFVYGAALEQGFTSASLLQDEARAYNNGKNIWVPQNFDGSYRGAITFRVALSQSINGATLDLAQKIGTPAIIRFARKMGIESHLGNTLPLALGSFEVSPLELTNAYAPFANGGFRVSPLFITAVIDSEGNTLEVNNIEREPVLDPALSYLMTSLLETTVTEGTAKSLRLLGWTKPSAGKTGTTNEGRDAWFIGYTRSILAGVWVGNDEGTSFQLSGAGNAIPIWGRFMGRVTNGRKVDLFEKPAGLTSVTIDSLSGGLARSGCPDQNQEIFLTGTEPKNYCPLHSGGFKGWLNKLFMGRKKAAEPLPLEKVDD